MVQEGGTHDFSLQRIEQKWVANYLNYSSFNKIFHPKIAYLNMACKF